MRVIIPIAFDVGEDGERIRESAARSAAEIAAFDYLAFCTVLGVNAGRESVEVTVDGRDEPVVVKVIGPAEDAV